MLKEIRITSFEEAIKMFFEDSYLEKIKRHRLPYVFILFNNANYLLVTSLI